MALNTLFGHIRNDVTTGYDKFPIGEFWNAVRKGWRTALFIEAMRNLAWSRGYLWYAEIDGMPPPFQRGGVLGLPCKSIQLNLADSSTMEIPTSTIGLEVPQNCGKLGTITMTLVDDEQGTIYQFFERWYNQVYNPYYGVLPVTEACKQLSLYRQKGSRRNVKRVYYDMDWSVDNIILANVKMPKNSDGYEFLVFPSGDLPMNLNSGSNDMIEVQVRLQIAYYINQDFGSPTVNNGQATIFDVAVGDVTKGSSWLDKIADYI